jgi:mersacidin/lichenicidin family type 2 lantibiotic
MSNEKIIRAWTDPEYRLSLSDSERALMPSNPAGVIELTDADLGAAGGVTQVQTPGKFCTSPCTTSLACPSRCGQKPPALF